MAFTTDEVLAGLAELITDETGISAPRSVPADVTSKPGRFEKTCSAVGLRSLFCEHTNRTRVMSGPWNACVSVHSWAAVP